MTRGPSAFTRHCSVRLSPIAENSPLLPPVGVWAVSQSQCG
uniref:ORF40s n=1 Tax=Pinus koraiensis TaxID=88728 RepID=Q85WW0_PINKO|nr:ORF40s [Pinus koraiensis]AAO74109.1 ORF40s [Pinus koraiensis]